MKKGFVSEIGWTSFLLIALIVMAFIGLIAVLLFSASDTIGGPSSDTVEFLAANDRPYMTANVLAYSMANDRQFLENSIEILKTGSQKKANALGLTSYFRGVFNTHGYGNKKFMSVAVADKDENQLYYTDNVPKRCGNDFSGVCIDKHRWGTLPFVKIPYLYYVGCSEGRKKIDDISYTENKCESLEEICCVEDSNKLGECGNGKGVCDWSGGCSAGRVEILSSSNDCMGPRGRGTCCVPTVASALTAAGITSRAEIPILYSDKTGVVQVTMT